MLRHIGIICCGKARLNTWRDERCVWGTDRDISDSLLFLGTWEYHNFNLLTQGQKSNVDHKMKRPRHHQIEAEINNRYFSLRTYA